MNVKIVQKPLPHGTVPYEDMTDPAVKRRVMLLNENILSISRQLIDCQRALIEIQRSVANSSGGGGGGGGNYVTIDTVQTITGRKKVVATGSTVERSIQDRFADTNNVLDFGAVGDGVTDDTAAIRMAVSSSAGKVLFFPKGDYLVNPGDSPIALGDIHIVGVGVQESEPPYSDNGSCISIVPSDRNVPAFILGQRVTVDGMTFYYPEQDGTTDDPVVFAATFRCRSDIQSKYIVFRNNTVVNAYKFIEAPESDNPELKHGFVGDWRIESNRIYSVFCDIDFNCSMDESSFITNNLFSFGVAHEIAVGNGGRLARWTARNGCHIRIAADGGSVDNLNVQNNNFFGAFDGILVENGKMSICNIADNLFDMTPHPLRVVESGVVDSSVFSGNIVTSKSYAGDVGYGDAIVIGGSVSVIDIKGNRIQNAPASAIGIVVNGAVFANVSGNEIWNFAHAEDASDHAGIRVSEVGQHGGGNWSVLTIANNDFHVIDRPAGRTGADIGIELSMNHATMTGNSFYGCSTCIKVNIADTALAAANRSVSATTGIGGAWAAGVESSGNAWH